MKTSRVRAACVGLLVVLCGCTTLPDSGQVHTDVAGSDDTNNQAPYFAPPGPVTNDSPSGIARGFLLAMQANPPSTAVARSFLTSRAKATWKPNEGTIVYDAATVDSSGTQVTARLRGAHRLSPEGAWLGGTDATTTSVPFTLVQQDGQWRIDNPPDALAVPASYFSSLFEGFNLYFFDHTGTVLVPTKVYVPRGEETATNLVRGLLAGPPSSQRDVAVSAFPSGLDLDLLAVVVSDAGIAEVPLGPSVLALTPAELNQMVVQLAWTLRQVPGITRFKITVDGAPVTLSDGRNDVSVSAGAEYDPVATSQRELLAINGGRVVRDDGDTVAPVAGPFGQVGFSLRSLAWSTRNHSVAGVATSGHRVFVAPDRGARASTRVRTVLDGGTNLLRPTYDRFGGLWLVDVTKNGAVVHLMTGRRDRVVQVEGISGRQVSAFTVTRDGTALVAVLASGTNPTVEVSNLVRDSDGRLQRATTVRTVQIGGADLGPARDVVQNTATVLAILTRPAAGPNQVVYLELDGSPNPPESPDSGSPDTVPGGIASLVASPDPALGLRAVTSDGRLFALVEDGRWSRVPLSGVVAAAYAQ
jgi:hypothetical protein